MKSTDVKKFIKEVLKLNHVRVRTIQCKSKLIDVWVPMSHRTVDFFPRNFRSICLKEIYPTTEFQNDEGGNIQSGSICGTPEFWSIVIEKYNKSLLTILQ